MMKLIPSVDFIKVWVSREYSPVHGIWQKHMPLNFTYKLNFVHNLPFAKKILIMLADKSCTAILMNWPQWQFSFEKITNTSSKWRKATKLICTKKAARKMLVNLTPYQSLSQSFPTTFSKQTLRGRHIFLCLSNGMLAHQHLIEMISSNLIKLQVLFTRDIFAQNIKRYLIKR